MPSWLVEDSGNQLALLDVVMVMPGMFSASPRVVVANVAVTLVLSVRLTTQVPVPEQPPPDQPVKMEPELVSPAAVKVMDVGARKEAEQVLPQEIPAGAEVTVPLPVPFLETVKVLVTGGVNEILPVMVAPGAEIPVRLKLVAVPL